LIDDDGSFTAAFAVLNGIPEARAQTVLKAARCAMEYRAWNDLIAAKFFNPEAANRPVLLNVTRELINELGRAQGVGVQDFIEAVKTGPDGFWASGICEKAEEISRFWRRKRPLYPPYLGYLALFVLAADFRGNFASHAYYPCRQSVLGRG
jgi:hypothetical protein